MSLKTLGLYVHVPFCVKKCSYCDFFSKKRSKKEVKDYFYALKQEINDLPHDFLPKTVYFGGGTPSCFENDELEYFLALFSPFLREKAAEERTFEVNPGTFTREKVKILRENGINRISLGVQSLNDQVLRFLGRIHTEKDAVLSIKTIKEAGIDNFSVDLMYGLPEEARQNLKMDINKLLELEPTHISTYCLSYEPNTELEEKRLSGAIVPMDDDQCSDEYCLICDILRENGYVHYEISNFCREGHECKHNLLYWTGNDYIGIGPAAHSFWKGIRYSNPGNMPSWQQLVAKHGSLNHPEPKLSKEHAARERIVFGLRILNGVNLREISDEYGLDVEEVLKNELKYLCDHELLIRKGELLQLPEKAMFISNSVFAELI